jgi:hypothetical protein
VFLIGVAQVKLVVLTGCDWDSMVFNGFLIGILRGF